MWCIKLVRQAIKNVQLIIEVAMLAYLITQQAIKVVKQIVKSVRKYDDGQFLGQVSCIILYQYVSNCVIMCHF